MLKAKNYRPEIDGLRAIAVLSVIIFHLKARALPGGFVGVDIFFVISGFLISQNILKALANDRFSFTHFYLGRIKRLYPTYATVIIATTIGAWVLLYPEMMQLFMASVTSSLFYFSNINFWLESGYFDVGSELKPLLHTWSLSVEEQFYLFFPVLLFTLYKKRYNIARLLVGLLVLSFAANLWFVNQSGSAVFYLLPFRAWEFAVGGLLAAGVYPKALQQSGQKALLVLGTALIVGSVIFINQQMAFPGYVGILPVLGTYLVIGSSDKIDSHFLLSIVRSKLFVVTGLLSYALYLWHWPIIIFFKIYFKLENLPIPEAVIILAATFVLAGISTFIIEPPIRKGKFQARTVFGAVAVFSAAFLSFSFYVNSTHGASFRFPNAYLYEQTKNTEKELEAQLNPQSCNAFFDNKLLLERCDKYGESDNIDFVVWGDSHAINLSFALAASTKKSFIAIKTPGCPPLVGVQRADGLGSSNLCNSGLQDLIMAQLEIISPSHIILISRWSLYHHGWFKNKKLQPATHYLCDSNCQQDSNPQTSLAVFRHHYEQTLGKLAKISSVVVLKGSPVLGTYGEDILFMPASEQAEYMPNKAQHQLFNIKVNEIIDNFSQQLGYQVLDPSLSLCDETTCVLNDQKHLFYFDDNHLTVPGWYAASLDLNHVLQ
ncbi:MAG: acyltransferase [Algicola sp.]|nr:acyltransferase [Algicola sp.]